MLDVYSRFFLSCQMCSRRFSLSSEIFRCSSKILQNPKSPQICRFFTLPNHTPSFPNGFPNRPQKSPCPKLHRTAFNTQGCDSRTPKKRYSQRFSQFFFNEGPGRPSFLPVREVSLKQSLRPSSEQLR